MNFAKAIEIDGAPVLLIYAKTHGTHHHADIGGFTCLETGSCTAVRFEGETMPAPGEDTTLWLINKTQRVLGSAIEARSWESGIHIMNVGAAPASDQPIPAAA